MSTRPITHPDLLDGDQLVHRVKGDALHLVELVTDHGPDTLQAVIDYWGPVHTARVAIALAAAVDDTRTPNELWDWLGERTRVTSRSLSGVNLWQMWSKRNGPVEVGLPVSPAAAEKRRARLRIASGE